MKKILIESQMILITMSHENNFTQLSYVVSLDFLLDIISKKMFIPYISKSFVNLLKFWFEIF